MSKGKRLRAKRKAEQQAKQTETTMSYRWVSSLPTDARGSALKIAHAQDHLEEIGELIQGWIDASLDTLREEPDPDAPGYFIAWIDAAEIDANRLSLLIGECLQAFRSGLDHLAFELSSVFTVPMTEDVEKSSAFPILSGYRRGKPVRIKDQWAGALGSSLMGVTDPAAQAAIERLQPYHRGDEYASDPLWRLNELNNVDKHRLLHVTTRVIEGVGLPVNGPNLPRELWSTNVAAIGLPDGRLHTIEGGTPYTIEIGGPIATKGRTKVARWPMIPIDPSKPMHMNFRPVMDVQLAAGTPLVANTSALAVLGEINNHIVGEVFPPLVAFLE